MERSGAERRERLARSFPIRKAACEREGHSPSVCEWMNFNTCNWHAAAQKNAQNKSKKKVNKSKREKKRGRWEGDTKKKWENQKAIERNQKQCRKIEWDSLESERASERESERVSEWAEEGRRACVCVLVAPSAAADAAAGALGGRGLSALR